jgi:hypothetical protein
MGKIYDLIDAKLARWLDAQKIFFVATAPVSPDGHINCSPPNKEQPLDRRVTRRHLTPRTGKQNLTQRRKGAKRRGIVNLSLNPSVCEIVER